MHPLLPLRPTRLLAQRMAYRFRPRAFHASRLVFQERSDPKAHRNFYKSHGRALFKVLTLAFFSYQCFYWMWILFETETEKDSKNREIKSLEGEVRLLEEGRNSHRVRASSDESVGQKRLLEEGKKG